MNLPRTGNPYNQDNETSWLDWSRFDAHRAAGGPGAWFAHYHLSGVSQGADRGVPLTSARYTVGPRLVVVLVRPRSL